jgi:hypothetical protein
MKWLVLTIVAALLGGYRIATVVMTLVGALTTAMLAAHEPAQATSAYRPVGAAQELELAGYAKVLCSAVFVSGRDPVEAVRNSGDVLMASGRDKVAWHVEYPSRSQVQNGIKNVG